MTFFSNPLPFTNKRLFKGKGRPQFQNDSFSPNQSGGLEMNSLQIQLKSLESKF